MARRPDPSWKEVSIEAFNGGLDKSKRPEVIPQECLVRCDNVSLRQDRVIGDTGYTTFGPVVRGTPQTDYQYFKRNGDSELILVTTETIYKYAPAVDEWQYVSDGADTNSNLIANAGDLTISVVDETGFDDNDYIGIILDDGSQHQTRVNGTPAAGIITFDDAIPVGRNAPDGTAIVAAVQLAGDLDFIVSIVPVPAFDWIVFTNGIDLPKYYDGTICDTVPGLPVGFNTCKAVANYNATLFLLNCTEGGLNLPQRIRRSNIGDPTEWVTGLAGYDDLYNSADFILGAEPMGPYLVVYRERSIVRGQFVNTAGKTYEWDTSVDGEGASSTQSVVNLNAQHLLFANAGIYSYTGGYDLESVGDSVFYQIFGAEGDLNTSFRHRIFCFYVEELDEAWFFYPRGASEHPNTLLKYNVGDASWSRRLLSDEFVGFGFYQNITSRRWVDLIGPWSAQTWRWDSRTVSSDSPTTHLMSFGQSRVMEYDYIATDDAGTAITVAIETKDFFNKDFGMRFDLLQLWLRGTDILVEYSTDAGGSFETLGTITSLELEIHTLSSQFVCDKIRFRLSGSNEGFELGWLRFEYKEEVTTRYRT